MTIEDIEATLDSLKDDLAINSDQIAEAADDSDSGLDITDLQDECEEILIFIDEVEAALELAEDQG